MASVCSRCNQAKRQVGPLLLPHACKVVTRVAPVFHDRTITSALTHWGEDTLWAPEVYAQYYATSPLVYSAVKLRAEAVARPRLKVWTMSADGTEQESLEDHPLQLLLDKANPWWAAGDLWRGTSTMFDLFGAAFWVLENLGTDRQKIWLARPDKMRVIPSKADYISGFEYGSMTPGGGKHYAPEEIVWFRNFNPLDEFAGLSPIAPGRLSIDMATDAAAHNRNVFKNGIMADVVGLTDGPIDQTQVDEIWERLKKKFAGPQNAHKMMLMGGMKDVKNLAMSARDMEFMASLRWSLEDICRVFGVPKTLLHDLEKATYSNIDGEERLFWRNTIVPQLMFYESAINEMLVPQFDPTGSIFVQFDLSDIEALQEDTVELANQEREDVKAGILTINEVRERRGLEPVPWGDEPPQPALSPLGQEQSPGDGKPPRPVGQPGDKARLATGPHGLKSLLPGDYRRWTPPEQTDKWLDDHWGEFSKRFDRQNDRFSKVQKDLFRRQLEAVIRRLRESGMVFGLTLFDPAQWVEEFLAQGRDPMIAALATNANAQIDAYRLGISFDLSRPVVQEWIDARLSLWTTLTNEETARLLNQEVVAALDAGESIRDMQGRVEKVFNYGDVVRSERISRTEMLSASNKGALEAYRQSGVVERKRWLATRDSRVRDAHAEANGQVVALDVPFLVMGESVMTPGEGSPANSINCRCTIVPLLEARRSVPVHSNGHVGA